MMWQIAKYIWLYEGKSAKVKEKQIMNPKTLDKFFNYYFRCFKTRLEIQNKILTIIIEKMYHKVTTINHSKKKKVQR